MGRRKAALALGCVSVHDSEHKTTTRNCVASLIVENLLPRILSFRGQALVLIPGRNKVDKDLWLDLWDGSGSSSGRGKVKKDDTLKWYYGQGALGVADENGKAVTMDGSPEKEKKIPKNLLGPNHRTASAMRSAKQDDEGKVNDTTKEPEEDPVPQAAPKRMGGGVPGNVQEAAALIKETEDPDMINDWLIHETRSTMVQALMARIDELE